MHHLDILLFLICISAAFTATIAATFDIIIADGTLSLSDTGLEFADTVTDAEGERLVDALRPAVCMEEGILRRGIEGLIFLQEVRGRERQAKTVLHPRLLYAQLVVVKAAASALQGNTRRVSIDIE